MFFVFFSDLDAAREISLLLQGGPHSTGGSLVYGLRLLRLLGDLGREREKKSSNFQEKMRNKKNHKGTDKAAHLHPVDLLVAGQKVVFNARYLLLQRSASKGGAVTDNVILEHRHTSTR